jgi:hypothetical protein
MVTEIDIRIIWSDISCSASRISISANELKAETVKKSCFYRHKTLYIVWMSTTVPSSTSLRMNRNEVRSDSHLHKTPQYRYQAASVWCLNSKHWKHSQSSLKPKPTWSTSLDHNASSFY